MKSSDNETRSPGDQLDAAGRRITDLEAELVRLREELARLRAELAQSTESASARIAQAAVRSVRRVVPAGSRRQQSLHTAASRTLTVVDHGPAALVERVRRERDLRRKIGVADTPAARRRQYGRWLALHTPSPDQLAAMRSSAGALAGAPVLTLIMPVHDPERSWLEAAIQSVLAQTYPYLELCIADDASRQPYVRTVLERAAIDPRVHVAFRDHQGGIAAAANSGLALGTGEFVGFVDHDDVLRPHALYAVAAYLRDHPDADLVYSDEDKLMPDGGLGLPAFKPEYSPDRLLAENYINHFTVMRYALVRELNGLREGFDGSQDHDLVLRVVERARHVGHVPDVLYAWRMAPGSTAIAAEHKPLAQEAGRRAVDDALRRRGIGAHVDFGQSPGLYIPRYVVAGNPSVDVLVIARQSADSAQECAATVERLSTRLDRKVTIVVPGAGVPAAINIAARQTTRDHIVLLDGSIRVTTPDWLEVMLELSQREGIGAVGARLRYRDGSVAHEGIVLGRLGVAANVDQALRVIKEVSAVSGACLMTRRAVFERAGGMDERFSHALFDVDYCMRLRDLGQRVVCTPLAELTWGEAHHTHTHHATPADMDAFVNRWTRGGEVDDPCLNRNVLWPNPLSLRLH